MRFTPSTSMAETARQTRSCRRPRMAMAGFSSPRMRTSSVRTCSRGTQPGSCWCPRATSQRLSWTTPRGRPRHHRAVVRDGLVHRVDGHQPGRPWPLTTRAGPVHHSFRRPSPSRRYDNEGTWFVTRSTNPERDPARRDCGCGLTPPPVRFHDVERAKTVIVQELSTKLMDSQPDG